MRVLWLVDISDHDNERLDLVLIVLLDAERVQLPVMFVELFIRIALGPQTVHGLHRYLPSLLFVNYHMAARHRLPRNANLLLDLVWREDSQLIRFF